MDAVEFQRVYESFEEFHSFFALTFGRQQWREHSGSYIQALLVQSQERRMLRIYRNQLGRRPGRCSDYSPRPARTMTR